MKRTMAVLLAGTLLCAAPMAVWAGEKAHYIEGSVANLKKGAEGMTHADGEKNFVFESKEGALNVPFERMTKLEFGLKSHWSVGYSILLGIHPKKVKDYALTIGFKDEGGADQAATFLLDKDRIFTTLINLQTRTNKDIDFEDKKACEYARKTAPPGQIEMDCNKIAKK